MKYYIQRQLNEYGPYTLADLQRYVAQGNIQLTDMARSEGMTDWVPVSQVLGNIPVLVPPAAVQPSVPNAYGVTPAVGGGTVYGGPGAAPGSSGTVYGGASTVYGGAAPMSAMTNGPIPTDFHWALVLLINFFCGVFSLIWLFIEAGFVKQIDRESKAIALLVGGIVSPIVAVVIFFVAVSQSGTEEPGPAAIVPLILFGLTGVVLQYVAFFQMRSSLEKYYNTVEPIHLRLSGVMTFFFNVYYFQYHLSRIAVWKKTGYIQPQ